MLCEGRMHFYVSLACSMQLLFQASLASNPFAADSQPIDRDLLHGV